MADELSAPLVRNSKRGKPDKSAAGANPHRTLPLARGVLLLLGLIGLGIAARLVFVHDPQGGRPSAEVAINSTHDANTLATEVSGSATITTDLEATQTPVQGGPSFITVASSSSIPRCAGRPSRAAR